ncbi:hypothetical protein [Belliella buryatensis]|uniref:hypothetical protein n=1 Tax=Belliella buryatensis TaxID=1500549 RepID=UPI000B798824|nr:hypothetical protein [Belliella buryatensis]
MNKIQIILHHAFRYVWNALFVISYPILATFGLLFIGVTYTFSALSRLLASLGPKQETKTFHKSDWEVLPNSNELIEAKLHKQIMFGPSCYQLRRKDGVPSILQDHYFGGKVRFLDEGILLEKWNATDSKLLPDFDICLYDPDEDSLTSLTNIKCYDWHISEIEEKSLSFKWFDGTQGGEVTIAR